jgi:hypothetical protein
MLIIEPVYARPTTALVDNRDEEKRRRERIYRQQRLQVVAEVSDNRQNGSEKKGAHRVKGEKKTVLRDPECQ